MCVDERVKKIETKEVGVHRAKGNKKSRKRQSALLFTLLPTHEKRTVVLAFSSLLSLTITCPLEQR